MKTKWKIVEHSWSDTSIYDRDGRLICTKSIDDEDCTEENQEELESEVQKDFNLIVCAPEMLDMLKTVSNCMHMVGNERNQLLLQEIDELINFAEKE